MHHSLGADGPESEGMKGRPGTATAHASVATVMVPGMQNMTCQGDHSSSPPPFQRSHRHPFGENSGVRRRQEICRRTRYTLLQSTMAAAVASEAS